MPGLNDLPMFFLEANTERGYVSCFKESYIAETGWRAFVLKGGPGSGKSLLLKRLAKDYAGMGSKVILSPSVSDPKSLSGIIAEDRGVIIYDGDLPDVGREDYPVVCEKIIDLGELSDEKLLMKFKPKIIDGIKAGRLLEKRAKGYVGAAAMLLEDNRRVAAECADLDKAESFARRLAEKIFATKKAAQGRESVRFLSGVTPSGMVYYRSTPPKLCGRIITISDRHGACAAPIMGVIRDAALANGYSIITCPSPLCPEKRIEHIFVEELGVAFVTANSFLDEIECEKTVHSRRFTDAALLRSHRQRMNFNRRAASELIDSAASLLSGAAAELERVCGYYDAAMDFERLDLIRTAILERTV